ncbi:MAG TPA: hypothetical protein VFR90_01445 [Methylibium sp.]|uniref:hypothetical protein n=1 Tax=Methylibium sp. TaxID=2067992 RepID=UPI002DBCBE35|nr:hypothetical protein [Methylibium sp.]HEU4457770.1 hypothetical protein [Methylibium sp.]
MANTYTETDLLQFRAIAAALDRDDEVDAGLALPFKMSGWLRQVGIDPPRWEVTEFGRKHLN